MQASYRQYYLLSHLDCDVVFNSISGCEGGCGRENLDSNYDFT